MNYTKLHHPRSRIRRHRLADSPTFYSDPCIPFISANARRLGVKCAYLQHTILFYVLHSKQNTDTLSENNSASINEQTICSHSQKFTAIVRQTNNMYVACTDHIYILDGTCTRPVANRSVDHAYSADSEGRCYVNLTVNVRLL